MTGREARWVRAPGMVLRRVAGEPLLVRVSGQSPMPLSRGADLLVLNATGERLWEVLAEPVTVADMARNLITEFEVSAAAAQDDVAAFVESLRDAGAIVVAEEQSTA